MGRSADGTQFVLPPSPSIYTKHALFFGKGLGGVGVVRGVGIDLKGWACRAAHQRRVLFGAASRRLLSVGCGRGGEETGGGNGSDFIRNEKIDESKRLKGEAARWNPRGFGFIRPTDGGEVVYCHFSSITDGNVLCEGDMVEYQAEYDDFKCKHRAMKVTGGRKEGGGDKQIAIQLNKKILSSNTETLCGIIKTRAADFNHVNAATALRKALSPSVRNRDRWEPRRPVPKEILDIVEESVMKNMLSFEPQGVANSLYIMAKKKYRPQERLCSSIEQRAEAISGEFKPQEFANTLWA
jgi:cold shock CspA family protein